MRPSSTARRYADAAFSVAGQNGDAEGWLAALRSASGTMSRHDVAMFFRDPKITSDEKQATIQRLFPNVPEQVLNLLRLLVGRQRSYLIPAIAREFEVLERRARGVTEAYVTVARPMSDEERTEIATRLGRVTGRTVELRTEVDPSILGGIVIRVGDRLIDASVAGRLQRLRQELAL